MARRVFSRFLLNFTFRRVYYLAGFRPGPPRTPHHPAAHELFQRKRLPTHPTRVRSLPGLLRAVAAPRPGTRPDASDRGRRRSLRQIRDAEAESAGLAKGQRPPGGQSAFHRGDGETLPRRRGFTCGGPGESGRADRAAGAESDGDPRRTQIARRHGGEFRRLQKAAAARVRLLPQSRDRERIPRI